MTDWVQYVKDMKRRKAMWLDHKAEKKAKRRLANKARKNSPTSPRKAKKKKRHDHWLPYKQRNAVLAKMGYDDYQTYLKSQLWLDIRRRVLERDECRCRVCGEPATEVHHKQYHAGAMDGRDISALASLCHRCHHYAEFDGKRKTTLAKANRRLKQLKESLP